MFRRPMVMVLLLLLLNLLSSAELQLTPIPEVMSSYKNYLVVLVHGMGGGCHQNVARV